MTTRFAERSTLAILVLGAALASAGCELLPGFLGSRNAPIPTSATAPLFVTIDRVDGTIGGAVVPESTLQATGLRSQRGLEFDLRTSEPIANASLTFVTAGVDGQNPYSGSREGDVDAGIEDFDPNRPLINACHLEVCLEFPDDFRLEIAQLADGSSVLFDAAWSGGDVVHVELHYVEGR